uniref:Uncharacterized protein n=1 Tax=Anguilla anguilla TaxID=7936 RepID=A0A0E9X992_ANGAN
MTNKNMQNWTLNMLREENVHWKAKHADIGSVSLNYRWSVARCVMSDFPVTVGVVFPVSCRYGLILRLLCGANFVDMHKHILFLHITVSVYLPNCFILLVQAAFLMDMCSTCWHYNCII